MTWILFPVLPRNEGGSLSSRYGVVASLITGVDHCVADMTSFAT